MCFAMGEVVVGQVLGLAVMGGYSLGAVDRRGSTTLVLLSFVLGRRLGFALGMCSGCRNI